jgi:hypothetical protein
VVQEEVYVEERVAVGVSDFAFRIHAFQHAVELEVTESGFVILDLFQVDGRLLTRLLDCYVEEGSHRIELERTIPSGVCFLRLSTPNGSVIRKHVLIH